MLVSNYLFSQGEQRYTDGTSTDQNQNTFEWINYGTQDWSIENTEVVTYRDGTPIPQVTDATEWTNLTTGAWCYYDNDSSKGKLYNWFAVMGIHDNDENTPNKELAPEGWRVPSDEDWTTLENYLISFGYNYDGTTTGNKIVKSMASTTGWNSSTIDGVPGNNQIENNSSGFNSYPRGHRSHTSNMTYSSFQEYGDRTIFWTQTIANTESGKHLNLHFDWNYLYHSESLYQNGYSVRFVRDLNEGDILLNGTVSVENNQIKNVSDPTHSQDVTTKNYVDSLLDRIEQLENQVEILEDYSDINVGNLDIITDIDGNEYPIVEIGGQKWVSKNLSVKTYRDGTPIPHVQDPVEWENLTTGAYRYVNDDPNTESKYGLMYNYYAVNNPRGLSPKGTRIPTLNDFIHLTSFLGYPCHEDSSPSNELFKGILTNDSTETWNNSDGSQIVGTNTTGFNLYPSGWFRYNGDTNTQYGRSSFLWTTEGPYNDYNYYLIMRFSSSNSTNGRVSTFSLPYPKSGLCVRVLLNN